MAFNTLSCSVDDTQIPNTFTIEFQHETDVGQTATITCTFTTGQVTMVARRQQSDGLQSVLVAARSLYHALYFLESNWQSRVGIISREPI